MSISGNGRYEITADQIRVDEGQITITGDDGGFYPTISQSFYPGTSNAVSPIKIGSDGSGPATLTLIGGGDGVNITVEDAGAPRFSAQIDVGADGNSARPSGTLNVTNGATLVSINNGEYVESYGTTRGAYNNFRIGRNDADGVVNVSGDGSLIAAYGLAPRISVGRNNGTGELNVTAGGEVRAMNLEVGRSAGSHGAVVIDGTGSKVALSSDYGLFSSYNGTDFSGFSAEAVFGRGGGTGELTISDGGQIVIENTDGLTDGPLLILGRDGDSIGILRVTGDGSTVNITQNGAVGDDNYFGSGLNVGSTGQGLAYISDGGRVNVTGDGADVFLGGDFDDGDITARQSLLKIYDGGQLYIDSAQGDDGGLRIAYGQDSVGRVEITGSGSFVDIRSDGDGSGFGGAIEVGRRGDGELIVSEGGTVHLYGGNDRFPTFFVGVTDADGIAQGTGYTRVSGAGSQITINGENADAGAFIGIARRPDSKGTLIVEDGGLVAATGDGAGMEIAGGAPESTGFIRNTGLVTVDGTGSRLKVTDTIAVGGDIIDLEGNLAADIGGNGRLNVQYGAKVTTDRLFIGNFGALAIHNAEVDANLLLSGDFFVGGEGVVGAATITGDLTEDDGRIIVDVNAFSEGDGDALSVSGNATLDQGALTFDISDVSQLSDGDEFVFLTASGNITATINAAATFIGNEEQFVFEISSKTVADGAGGSDSTLVLTVADATKRGSDGNDELAGEAGDDVIDGGRGNDVINGGAGNDDLAGGGGRDELLGGRGADTLSGGQGADTLTGNGGRDLLIGNGGRDALNGGGGRDNLNGGGGRDELNGGGGKDILQGGGGADTLDGGGGRDTMDGGGGRDILLGGRGLDMLTGGGGADQFVFGRGDSRDVITDFRQGVDRIEITDGANGFADLNISQFGDDVRITFANVRVTVLEDEIGNFAANDFIFS